MTLDLKGKKVVLIGGKHSIGRAIAEAVAREGADAVIWARRSQSLSTRTFSEGNKNKKVGYP